MQQHQQDQFDNEVQQFQQLQVDPTENNAHASYFRGRKAVQHPSDMPYKCIGKIVCVQYGQCGETYFQYGTAFKIAGNLVITDASVLVSRKTNTVFKEIFYYPSELLSQHGKFDFQKSRGLKVINCHISHSYFGQLQEKILNEQIQKSMASVAICELKERQGLSGCNKQWLKINFQYKLNFKVKYQDEALVCGFSQHQNDQRHLLYAQKKPIQSLENDGLITYQHTTYDGYEGAPIIVRSKEGCYEVVGMHTCKKGQLNKGILLKVFFEKYERWVEYQIRNQVKIDFHELLKNSFNKLLEKFFIDACNYKERLTQRQTNIQNLKVELVQKSLQLESLQSTISSLRQKSQQQSLLIAQHQHTIQNLHYQFHLKSQNFITQRNKLQAAISQLQHQHQTDQYTIKSIENQLQKQNQQLQRLHNRQGTMNAQVIRLKNQRLRTLESDNHELKEDNYQLRTSLVEIKERLERMQEERVNLQQVIEELRKQLLAKDQQMERLKQRLTQELNIAITQHLQNLQYYLELKISIFDDQLTTIHQTISQQRIQAQQSRNSLKEQLLKVQQELDSVTFQLHQERQLNILLEMQNSNLKQRLNEKEEYCSILKVDYLQLQQEKSENSIKINQMLVEMDELKQQLQNHHNILRNPRYEVNAIKLFTNPTKPRSRSITRSIHSQIEVPSHDITTNRMIREKQEQEKKEPLQQSIVDINDKETEANSQSIIQRNQQQIEIERVINLQNNEQEQSLHSQPQDCQLLKNIFFFFNRQSSSKQLQLKLNQIKLLYQQQIKHEYNLKPALDYVKQIYKPKNLLLSQIPDKYFKNFKQRIERNLNDHQLKLTENGYNLYLEDVNWNVEKFFQYDWVNLEYLCLVGCKVNNHQWSEFCQKAEIFLPNLKALYITPNDITEVKEKDLMSFWSVERIWFAKKENKSKLSKNESSKQQIKRFIENKKVHHQIQVRIVY